VRVLTALLGMHRREPLQALLLLGGLALSLAVVVAIDLAIGNARAAFSDARAALSGAASHRLLAVERHVDEAVYGELRRRGLRAAPVLQGTLRLDDGRRIGVLGIDPLAEWALRPQLLREDAGAPPALGLLAGPAPVALGHTLAAELGVVAGDRLRLPTAGAAVELQVVAVLGDEGPGEQLLVADIGLAQRLLGAPSQLSRIDLQLDDTQAAALLADLPPGSWLEASADGDALVLGMSRAFEINLQALSLLALLVGVFLVFQSIGFLGLRRRRLVGLLRCLGVDAPMLRRWLLAEALLIGLVAALIGLLLGTLLGLPLQEGLARSYRALFYAVGELPLRLPAETVLKALLLGVAGALLAAWRPLQEALAVEPRAALQDDTHPAAATTRGIAAGLLLAALGGGLLAIPAAPLWWVFVALFLLLVALLFLLPRLAAWLLQALRLALRLRLTALQALLLGGLQRSLGRTGTALAALTLAMATLVGMSAMIDSFRASVARWIDRSLTAEAYLTPREGGELDPALIERLRRLDGLAALGETRRRQVPHEQGPVWLVAYAMPPRGFAGFELLASAPGDPYTAFQRGDVLVSEPLANRLGLAVGDVIALPTASGLEALPIAGIYRDYSSPQGTVAIAMPRYRTLYADRGTGALAFFATPGREAELDVALAAALAGRDDLLLSRASDIRTRSLEIFARTFAITDLLRCFAGLIAAIAVFGALSALQLERQRELALLRCLGLSPTKLLGVQLQQALLFGLLAALFALPLGSLLAALLTEVIQQRAFGWSMQLRIGAAPLLTTAAIAMGCAALAGLWPAWRVARRPLPELLRGAA
jgi:putative ABC transport system permease protein